MSGSPSKKMAKVEKTELDYFDDLFPQLVNDLTAPGQKENKITDALHWFKRVTNSF